MKERIKNGDYAVVNCIFDSETNQVIEIDDSQAIQAESVDQRTEIEFADKDMIIFS